MHLFAIALAANVRAGQLAWDSMGIGVGMRVGHDRHDV